MPAVSADLTVRILAVDDCPVQRIMITRYLESAGYLVVAVETGREALQAALPGRFNAVILDVNMPDIDGPAIGRALRANPATSALPIVMYSTESEAAVRERFSAFEAFVEKPSSASRLIKEVDELVLRPPVSRDGSNCLQQVPCDGKSHIAPRAY